MLARLNDPIASEILARGPSKRSAHGSKHASSGPVATAGPAFARISSKLARTEGEREHRRQAWSADEEEDARAADPADFIKSRHGHSRRQDHDAEFSANSGL